MLKPIKKDSGLTLIEILISSLLVISIFLASSHAYILSKKWLKKSSYELIATAYARETLERLLAEDFNSVLLDSSNAGIMHDAARNDTPDILTLPQDVFTDTYNALRYYVVKNIDLQNGYNTTLPMGATPYGAKEVKVTVEYDEPFKGARISQHVTGLVLDD